MNGWMQQGVFTAFVENEAAVSNYPVPAGGMVVLVNLHDGKMWFKSVDGHGVPLPLRVFDIKEKAAPPSGTVTRAEFDALSSKLNDVADSLAKLVDSLK